MQYSMSGTYSNSNELYYHDAIDMRFKPLFRNWTIQFSKP